MVEGEKTDPFCCGGYLKRLFLWIAAAFLIGGGLSALWQTSALAQFPPAPGTGPGLPETIEAIESARITTPILFVTAHPDDESAATLTYPPRGLHADGALLTLTTWVGQP